MEGMANGEEENPIRAFPRKSLLPSRCRLLVEDRRVDPFFALFWG